MSTAQHHTPAPLPPSTAFLISQLGHDFNNLLGIILGGLSLLREDLPDAGIDDELHAVLDDMFSATRDASEVIERLTAAAGRQITQPRAIDLNACLSAFAEELRTRVGAGVRLQVELCPHSVMAWVDPLKLHQCLSELVSNSLTAMSGNGELRLACSGATVPALTVIDSGPGMDPDILKRCTQPYVTTWRNAGHRGLGLSVVMGLLQVSEAQLVIESATGEGTRVLMEFTSPDAIAGA